MRLPLPIKKQSKWGITIRAQPWKHLAAGSCIIPRSKDHTYKQSTIAMRSHYVCTYKCTARYSTWKRWGGLGLRIRIRDRRMFDPTNSATLCFLFSYSFLTYSLYMKAHERFTSDSL